MSRIYKRQFDLVDVIGLSD